MTTEKIEHELSKIVPIERDVPTKGMFLNRLHDRKYEGQQITQTLFLNSDTIPNDATVFHKNYLEYLQFCWNYHRGIYVNPDILWYTLLTEITEMVAEDSEKYRYLFTDSVEKKTIYIDSPSCIIPLNILIEKLKPLVPSNIDLFLPTFSTTSDRSRHAMYAAFCDLCSPYYNYMMLACGIPAIRVEGSEQDWYNLSNAWNNLCTTCFSANPNNNWLNSVTEILNNCIKNLNNSEFWKKMFYMERCGSGSQQVVEGWFAKFFRKNPSLAKVENFSSGISIVSYEHLDMKKKFKMQEGLFYSHEDGIYLIPDFGFTVHEVKEVNPEPYTGYDARNAEKKFCERTGQEYLSKY